MEMSRREKQADLRRRMAEARVRLAGAAQASSTSSLTQDDYQDDGNDRAEESSSSSSSSSAIQPPPPSSSQSHTHLPSAGGGGILKKSKYSASSSSSSTGIAAAVSTNTPKLGVLMAGYANSSSSSSDEDENDITTNRVQIASHPPTIATSISTTEKRNDVGDKTDPSSILLSSSSAYKISDSVWDEFEALLEKDEEEMMSSLKVKGVNQMDEDDITTSLAATVVDRSDVKSIEAKSTKKTKKRKRSRKEENNDELTTNNDQEDIEQVSYEARLARLMLLRVEKRRRGSSGKNGGENSSSLSSSSLQFSSSMNEFYDSGLAFQHEGLDDDENEKVGIGDNENHVVDKNPRQDSYDATSNTAAPADSGAMLASSCPPSLADILREKRDEARKLSSTTRGAADDSHINNENTSDDIDCVSDGRWFF